MGYRKIENLYKNKNILMFKQAYALEKIHGSSAHVTYIASQDKLVFFSGGAKHQAFLNLFDQEELLERFRENNAKYPHEKITIYGEVYAGSMRGMCR